MRIERIDHGDGLAALESSWREIEQLRTDLPVFQSLPWNALWCRNVLPNLKGASLRAYVLLSDSGHPSALLPCFGRRIAGRAMMLSQFLGHRHSFRNDAILSEPKNPELAMTFIQLLRRKLAWNEVMLLRHMDSESEFSKALFSSGLAERQCGRLCLPRGRDSSDLLQVMSKSRRKNLQRSRKKLLEQESAEFRVVPRDETESALATFFALHELRFQSKNEDTLLTGVDRKFVQDSFSLLSAQGKAELLEIRKPDRAVASMIGIHDGDHFYFINGGFDPQFQQYSPLKLLVTFAMQHAFSDLDCSQFELGPDYEAYKQDWKPTAIDSYFSCFAGSNLYGSVAAALGTRAFRIALRRSS